MEKLLTPAQELHSKTGKPLCYFIYDMLYASIRYGISLDEYRQYRFYELSGHQKASYHSTIANVRLIGRINSACHLYLLRDKGLFLKRFQAYAGRDFLDLREAVYEEFCAFIAKHRKIIIKPYHLSGGQGIVVYDDLFNAVDLPGLYADLKKKELYIVEEFLQQHPAISAIYPTSINTVRIFTLLSRTHSRLVLLPQIRFGSNGGQIDFHDEITCLINQQTGRILTDGITSNGETIVTHPDTMVRFKNAAIPFFQEAVELTQKAALAIPEVRYIGWDIAITPAGPVIIEGNGAPGYWGIQMLASKLNSGYGCKALFTEIQ